MTKIVINTCYGGFGLSKEAILLGRKLSGDPLWKGGKSRTDKALVLVVEQLGEKASDSFASLTIRELPKGTKYRIQEYDGKEWIETSEEIQWEIA